MDNKHKFDCAILTQGMDEGANDFAIRISDKINELLANPAVLGSPYALPMSDGRGRKEVIIQWVFTDPIEPIKPSSLLALVLQLGNIKDTMGCESQKEGYQKCIDDIARLFPEIENQKQHFEAPTDSI